MAKICRKTEETLRSLVPGWSFQTPSWRRKELNMQDRKPYPALPALCHCTPASCALPVTQPSSGRACRLFALQHLEIYFFVTISRQPVQRRQLRTKVLYTDTCRGIYRVYKCQVWFNAIGTRDHRHCCFPFENLPVKFSSRFGGCGLSSTPMMLHDLCQWYPKPAGCCGTAWSETASTSSYADGTIPIFNNWEYTETRWVSLK